MYVINWLCKEKELYLIMPKILFLWKLGYYSYQNMTNKLLRL